MLVLIGGFWCFGGFGRGVVVCVVLFWFGWCLLWCDCGLIVLVVFCLVLWVLWLVCFAGLLASVPSLALWFGVVCVCVCVSVGAYLLAWVCSMFGWFAVGKLWLW